MFGFGRSAQEKAAINWVALHFQQLGLADREALRHGEQIVDEVLTGLRARGIDPYKVTQGDEYLAREQFTEPRLRAGLTTEDIRAHWNRPLLMLFSAVKVQELINALVVNTFESQGKTAREGGLHYKKNFPRYGDPAKWNPIEKFNEGLAEADADIYPEFSTRVDAWRATKDEAALAALVAEHGTLNAVIRRMVAERKL